MKFQSIHRIIPWFSILLGLARGTQAWANPAIKQLEIHSGNEVSLVLDGKVDTSQVTTEFFKDIIQLNLNHVSVYPAKVKSNTQGSIAKVFIYQYTPKQVRCRLTVRGSAEDFKKRFQLHISGRAIRVKLNETATASGEKSTVEKIVGSLLTPQEEQKKLQEKIENTPIIAPTKPERVVVKSNPSGSAQLTGAKPLPSFGGVFVKLSLVVGIFGVFALALKKLGGNKKSPSQGILSAISKVSGLSMGRLGKKEPLIEVLSTQHLGPKKSISVVRVAGRTLVLGLSQDSIQLITQINDDSDDQDSLDELELTSSGEADLDKISFGETLTNGLGAVSAKPSSASFAEFLGEQKAQPSSLMESQGVRSRIKSRLEGLKPL